MQYRSTRRRQEYQNSLSKELRDVSNAISKEQKRKEDKERKRRELERSSSYQAVKNISIVMDKYLLDPLLGFIVPVGGDILTNVFTLPAIYVAAFKVKSLPLTLAVIYNGLMDMLLGNIPYFIGAVIDVFNRSHHKNFKLIKGFVEDDREVISEVNRKAFGMGVGIVVLSVLIYFAIKWTWALISWVIEFITGLFA